MGSEVGAATSRVSHRWRFWQLETFGSLRRNPNFRLYWLGACLSNVGTWMQIVAQGWLVYVLTDSPFLLGLVSFAGSIPILGFSIFGGELADRVERRRLMVWTQTGMMLLAFLLAALTIARVVTVWHIIVIAFLNGVVNAFNTPVRQSIISDLVPREDLQNAIAINSAQFQTSRMVGPALAGLALAAFGAGWCFFINGLSFLAVIGALLIMDVPPLPPRKRQSVWRNVGDGLRYVGREPVIFALLMVAAIPSLFGQPYQAMMPAVALGVLHTDAAGLGVLQSGAGAGALVGALVIASLSKARRGRLMLTMLMLFGVSLGFFSLSQVLPLSVFFVFWVGFSSMAYSALNQTFLQTLVADEMRGRVLSLLTLTTFGLQPFGALQAGFVASYAGVSFALLLGGAICLLAGIVANVRYRYLSDLE
jgi:MFS family permease